jgi:phosphoribosylformylglycinamidine cyclo-ligase
MTTKKNSLYKESGVDIDAGNTAVSLIQKHIRSTFTSGVLDNFGSFSGAFEFPTQNLSNPLLISGTDGVGTKLKLAIEQDKHDTIGIDLVAMCANDILTCGARPLFFLDYMAQGKLIPERVEQVVKGIAEGCRQCGAALIGGETAEMPDMYAGQDYDLAGFIVGVVDKPAMITGESIEAGDCIVGIASSGFHSNGYSLIRQICFKHHTLTLDYQPDFATQTLGNLLLTPTRIYEPILRNAIETGCIKGMAHITGGGLLENIPRVLPDHLTMEFTSWELPPIFRWLQELGQISNEEMQRVFNLGWGMVLIIAPNHVDTIIQAISEPVTPIGTIVAKPTA